MDGSHYQANGVNTTSSGQTYPSPTAISPHHLQTASPLPQHALPPASAMQQQQPPQQQQPMYGSNPHTPRTPGTPNTPNSTHNVPPYQQQASQAPGGRPIYAYPPPHQGYGTSGGMMPQATTAASHPQPIAPAPTANRGPPVLRPMPPGGVLQQNINNGYQQPGGNNMLPVMPPITTVLQEENGPTRVVGSQGRRGILPSAPGRPAAPQAGSGNTKSAVIPVKDADGKFPCPHCTKTYLHAKHLKRHLLRHTGDRPYMCVLCRDTFSRSDILKRHFQKCSIRRGNPTGVSHLSHPQAHVKKNQQQKNAAMGNEGDLNQLNGLNNMPNDSMVHPFGMVPVNDGMNNMPNDQNQLSRSNSVSRLDNGNQPDRRSIPGPVMGGSQPYGNDPNMNNQQMSGYSMPPGQNGMPMYGGSNQNPQSGLDWSQMFQAGAHQPHVNTSFPPNLGQNPNAIKAEPNYAEPQSADGASSSAAPSKWGVPPDVRNPFSQLSDNVLNFLYPPSQSVSPHLSGIHLYFAPTKIKDFLDKYTHFHVHTPILHPPTFKIMEAYPGLLTAMCCIGACYSDLVEASEVRIMMDALWVALERDCPFLSSSGPYDDGTYLATAADTERLQAVLVTGILTLWNGNPSQRARARRVFSLLADEARRLHLMTLSNDPSVYSPLHQSDFDPSIFRVEYFNWPTWVEQERRVRVMLGIFLGDVAMGLYFNIPPRFDPLEMALPLPCDDAAWDAVDEQDCACALGLHGAGSAEAKNPFGTRRASQPEVRSALMALLHQSVQIQPGATNLYGKFVLIHAILSLIRRALTDGESAKLHQSGLPPARDWVTPIGAGGGAAIPSQGAGPDVDSQSLKAASIALDKFKHNWDMDMSQQFPRSAVQSNNPQRSGFSRDGIYFYWLAKYILKYTNPADLKMEADKRFMQVMHLLKGLRTWVQTDGASRGEELGSLGDIDEEYGTMDLTLDMAKLFRPLPQVSGDAEVTSAKAGSGNVTG